MSAALADILGEVSAAAVDVAELDSAFAHDIIYSALDLCDIEETVFQTVYDCADDAADAVEIDAVVFGQMERAVQACELDNFILDVVYDIVDTIPTTSERWKEDMAFEAAAAERMAFVTKLKDKARLKRADHPTSRSTSRASTKIEELQQKLDALREQHKQAHENIHEKRRWGEGTWNTRPITCFATASSTLEQSESIWDEEPAVALRYRKNPLYDPILETNDDILEWEPNEPDAFVLPESVADPDESVDDLEEVTPDPRRQRAMARDELAARAYRQKQQLVSSPKATPKNWTKLKDELPTGLAIKRAERAERIAAKTRIAHEKALLAQENGRHPHSLGRMTSWRRICTRCSRRRGESGKPSWPSKWRSSTRPRVRFRQCTAAGWLVSMSRRRGLRQLPGRGLPKTLRDPHPGKRTTARAARRSANPRRFLEAR